MELTHTTPENLDETIRTVHERFLENLDLLDEGEPIDLRDEFDRHFP